jgi:hypothetical protein
MKVTNKKCYLHSYKKENVYFTELGGLEIKIKIVNFPFAEVIDPSESRVKSTFSLFYLCYFGFINSQFGTSLEIF